MTDGLQDELFEQSLTAIALVDLGGYFVKVNPAFCALLGANEDQVVGHSFREFTIIEDLSKHTSTFNRLLTGELKHVTYERNFLKKDGSYVATMVNIGTITKNNQPQYFYTYAHEITTLKNREEKLISKNHILEAKAKQKENYLDIFINNNKDAFFEFDEDGNLTKLNLAAKEMFSLGDDILNKKICEQIFFLRRKNQNGSSFNEVFGNDADEGVSYRKRLYGRNKLGERFPIEAAINTYLLDDKRFYSVFIHDVSEKVDIIKKLIESKLRLNEITNNIPVLIAHIDKAMKFTFANKMYEKYFPCNTEHLLNTSLFDFCDRKFFAPPDFKIKKVYEKITYSFEKEMDIDGKTIIFNNTIIPAKRLQDGFYLLTTDITEFKNLQDIYKYDANHDLLTGLPNRRAVDHFLERYKNDSYKSYYGISVVFFDLNEFKKINDTYGHDIGDKVLIAFSRTINSVIRREYFFSRLSGDEFLLIMENLKEPEKEAKMLIERIRRELLTPMIIDGIHITISTSIGIAIQNNPDEINIDKLIIESDRNMYKDKKEQKFI
jgi:diguanylate cyclase (GGDEF)-like protein/PAS domain S-box-containing protein